MIEVIPWGRILYTVVFCGCFCYLVWDLPFRFNRILAVSVLAIILFAIYAPVESTLVNSLLRYGRFFLLYSLWSVAVLTVKKSYAVYLSSFFIIFMGVWFSCVQMLFSVLGIHGSGRLIIPTGICRVAAILLLKHFFIRVDETRDPTIHEFMLSLFPAAACFAANLVLYDYLNSPQIVMAAQYRTLVHILVVFFGLSALLVLISSEQYFQMNRYKEENERARQQLLAQYRLFLAEKENSEKLKALSHDMKNHLNTLAAMSGAGEAREYARELSKGIRDLDPPFLTGSHTLDALLMVKKADCEQKGIELTCFVHLVHPEVLSSMEICTLFGNCLDNAIEAASDPRVSNPYIHLSGGEINGNMVVRIRNPYVHTLLPKNGAFDTTKAERELHGYGLINIRHIVEQRGGTVTFRTEDGVFTVTWMIPISE